MRSHTRRGRGPAREGERSLQGGPPPLPVRGGGRPEAASEIHGLRRIRRRRRGDARGLVRDERYGTHGGFVTLACPEVIPGRRRRRESVEGAVGMLAAPQRGCDEAVNVRTQEAIQVLEGFWPHWFRFLTRKWHCRSEAATRLRAEARSEAAA